MGVVDGAEKLVGSKPLRVLLVEDDPRDALLVELALRDDPAATTFLHVTRLAEGIARVAECDIVLLDLTLPDSRGATRDPVTGRRQDPRAPRTGAGAAWPSRAAGARTARGPSGT